MSSFRGRSLLAVASAVGLTAGMFATTAYGNTSQQPVAVNMFAGVSSFNGNLNTNWFTTYAEKKFNMKINWDVVDSTDVSTKQPVLLASGDYPDIFWAGSFSNAQLLQYGQQGVFLPLNNLLQKYAPNVWHEIETTPALKQGLFAPNGNIYGLPGYNYCLHCDFSAKYWVYKPFLQKYHLSIPHTTTQFEHMLDVFKQHGILPLTGSTTGWHSDPTTFLMNSFIYDDGSDYLNVDSQGKLSFAPVQSQWKEGLLYLHGLYSKGLISTGAFTQTDDVLEKQAINHQVGVVPWGCMNCVLGASHQSDVVNWETIPPLTGSEGLHDAAFFGNGVGGATFTITNKANLQEEIAVMKLLNFIWTPQGNTIFDFGQKGKFWTPAKKGQKGLMGTQALFDVNWVQPSPFIWGWNQLGPMDQSETWRNGYVAPSPFKKDGTGSEALLQYYTEKDYVGNQPKYVVPSSLWVQPAEGQQYALLTTNIDNYVNQWTDEFITGSKSLSQDWNTYVSGVQALELNQYLSMTQSAMGKPFNTSGFKKDPADIHFLQTEK